MLKKYYVIISLFIINAVVLSQGIDFPSEPAQAPISGLGLLAVGGGALAYKKLRRK
tara:strand:+ start:380 stop:547 length:168 start_codon:yes stop_codon:yes gene_type:complete